MRRVGGQWDVAEASGARCLKHLLLGDATASPQLHVQGSFLFFSASASKPCVLPSFEVLHTEWSSSDLLTQQRAAPSATHATPACIIQ